MAASNAFIAKHGGEQQKATLRDRSGTKTPPRPPPQDLGSSPTAGLQTKPTWALWRLLSNQEVLELRAPKPLISPGEQAGCFFDEGALLGRSDCAMGKVASRT